MKLFQQTVEYSAPEDTILKVGNIIKEVSEKMRDQYKLLLVWQSTLHQQQTAIWPASGPAARSRRPPT
jgi:hypothetical protein